MVLPQRMRSSARVRTVASTAAPCKDFRFFSGRLPMLANDGEPGGQASFGQGSDQEQQDIHLGFRRPSAWTRPAAQLDLATAADK
ncbi:hypothetical protein ABT300_28610 [Streptomyces sp. NPDC001027]|uniref:hypothetical protein n=1 Tax=Streptomyces sp. NPDC001027 TaxID=3154771 RepID=UPI00331D46AA